MNIPRPGGHACPEHSFTIAPNTLNENHLLTLLSGLEATGVKGSHQSLQPQYPVPSGSSVNIISFIHLVNLYWVPTLCWVFFSAPGKPQWEKQIDNPVLVELSWTWAMWPRTARSPPVVSPPFQAQLLSEVFPDPLCLLWAQQQWMPAWFIWHFVCVVWIVFCIFTALSLPGLTEDTLKGEDTMKMEAMVSASVGSWLQTLPCPKLLHRVVLCPPSQVHPGPARHRASQLLVTPPLHLAPQH